MRLPGAGAGEPCPTARDQPDEEMSYEEALAADAEAGPDDDERRRRHAGVAGRRFGRAGRPRGRRTVRGGRRRPRRRAALDDARRRRERDGKDPAATIAGAGLGAAVTAAEAAAGAAKQVADTIGPAITWLVEPRFAKDAGEMAAGAARVLDGQWKASQAEMVDAATSFLGALVPEIAQGLADQVDLTALVRERVDVNAIVEDVDIDRILDRVDIDAVIDRIDIDEIVARVDVNRAADQVDVDRDRSPAPTSSRSSTASTSPTIAEEVIDEIDLPRLVRESSGIMANETVQTVRVQGMNADRLVSRVVDRVLRREARDLLPPEHDAGGASRERRHGRARVSSPREPPTAKGCARASSRDSARWRSTSLYVGGAPRGRPTWASPGSGSCGTPARSPGRSRRSTRCCWQARSSSC